MLVKQFAQGIHIECMVFVHHFLAWFFNFGQWQRLPNHSDDRQRVWQEPIGALAEASSIEDTKIETKDSAEGALELVHPAVLMELHLIIYLSFSKSEGGDQMSPMLEGCAHKPLALLEDEGGGVGHTLQGLSHPSYYDAHKVASAMA